MKPPEESNVFQLLNDAYSKVWSGLQRIDMENESYAVRAYRVGSIIRIDVKEKGTQQ